MKILLTVLLFLSSFSSYAEEHYKIKNVDSDLVGATFTINKPMALKSGVPYCNNLDKYDALNTSCLMNERAKYKLTELTNNCFNCLNEEGLKEPINIIYKKELYLKVLGVFETVPNYFIYRIFSSPIKYLLVSDQDNNLIEMYEIEKEIYENKNATRDDKNILSNNTTDFVVKQYCFVEEILPVEDQKKNIKKMINKLGLSGKVDIEDRICNFGKKRKGFVVVTRSFNDFLTFQYFLSEFNIIVTEM